MLRDRSTTPRVTNMELFFDLVYVFAVTQLSHRLLQHLTGRGALETLVLFGAVWWAWNYTAWATNYVDPDRPPVRVMLVALMLLSLVMSAAIPEAFDGRAFAFAGSYVALQLVRSAFVVVAFRGHARMRRNYVQLLAWSAIAGAVWIAGAAFHDTTRLVVWIAALALDVGAPMHGFALPRLGATAMSDWKLAGAHLAERCQLVVIIALGESILVTGVRFSELAASAAIVAAFAVAFVGSVALWWIYFAYHAEEGARTISGTYDPARMGRSGYAYAHAIMVAGIIVVAVADENVIARPTGDVHLATAATVLGGPALYLAGNALFNRALSGRIPLSRLEAIGALAVIAALAAVVTPLVLAILATIVVVALVAADLRTRRAASVSARVR